MIPVLIDNSLWDMEPAVLRLSSRNLRWRADCGTLEFFLCL